jgi:Domain of unknown function (DUF6378)
MRDPLLVEREKTHGDFKNVADISQRLKHLLDEYNSNLINAQREALDMIAVKVARILAGDPRRTEHWNDIAGYARLGAEACLTDKQA